MTERQFNEDRVVVYPKSSWVDTRSISRCTEILKSCDTSLYSDINDAVELHECKKLVEMLPEHFGNVTNIQAASSKAAAKAYASASQLLNQIGLSNLYEQIEIQYADQFWDLLEASNGLKSLAELSVTELLQKHPHLISTFIHRPQIIKCFDSVITQSMIENPEQSARAIIRAFGAESDSTDKALLPKTLTNDAKDKIMQAYLEGSQPNLNLVHVLAHWPVIANSAYSPSAKVKVAAERKEKELTESLFDEHPGIEYGIGVRFDEDQVPCLDILGQPRNPIFSYSKKWLTEFRDPATILNNFVYVFQFVSRHGLLCMPSNPHLIPVLIQIIGTTSKKEYAAHDHLFFVHDSRCVATTAGYSALLRPFGTSIEAALDWYYTTYLKEELEVASLNIGLPSSNTSFFEKCTMIGPAIERAVKAYTRLVEDGEIDTALIKHMRFGDFKQIPSFITRKYACEGAQFGLYANSLFSDQSPLFTLTPPDLKHECTDAFTLLYKQDLSRSDFHEFQQECLDKLIELNLLEVLDGCYLKPTTAALLLKKIWEEGALTVYSLPNEVNQEIQKLVDVRCLQYVDSLLTPMEADYMSFVFNYREFSNALALRNTYDHGSDFIDDPNAPQYISDYYHLLNILISLTLKINDELVRWRGIDPCLDYIDWPLCGDRWRRIHAK